MIKTDPKDAEIISHTTILSNLEKKTSVLATVHGVGGNRTQTNTNTKIKEPNKIYFEGPNNIESWRANTSKEEITRDGQYWWWFNKHNMEGGFDGMYMNHTSNKH